MNIFFFLIEIIRKYCFTFIKWYNNNNNKLHDDDRLNFTKPFFNTIDEKIDKLFLNYKTKFIDSFSIFDINWDSNSDDVGEIWKHRYLCENTVQGNIILRYNDNGGFEYFSDHSVQNSVEQNNTIITI